MMKNGSQSCRHSGQENDARAARQPGWFARLWARARRAWQSGKTRREHAVFADLRRLCRSPGYIHALAAICARNDWITASGQLQPEDFSGQYGPQHLTRTEVSPLLGFLIRQPIDDTYPRSSVLKHYISETQFLLKQFHRAVAQASIAPLLDLPSADGPSPATNLAPLREAMLYTGDSAYHFQYLDFATRRYAEDNAWFLRALGASVADFETVLRSIVTIQQRKFEAAPLGSNRRPHHAILDMFTLVTSEIVAESGVDSQRVEMILDRFAVEPPANAHFQGIHDFNEIMEKPLVRRTQSTYILFQFYTLMESFYTSPSYWMQDDRSYAPTGNAHRGETAEKLAHDLLCPLFGASRVHKNVTLYKGKSTIGEIDVLAIFGDRVVLSQVKCKKLTLAARSGDERHIKGDFQKAIQDSYEQAFLCATAILESNVRLRTQEGTTINLPRHIKEVYPLCILAEHYPALGLQTRLILRTHAHPRVRPPVALDLFALDTLTEFLDTAIRFINYLDLRARFREKAIANHEHVLLALHLRQNLWLEDLDYDMVVLPDDLTQDIDAAMYARRIDAPGQRTPIGILTQMPGTTAGRLVAALEKWGEPASNALAIFLLQCSGDTFKTLSDKVDDLMSRVKDRGGSPMVSMFFLDARTGVCIQCSRKVDRRSVAMFQAVCEARKYDAQVNDMFGVNLEADGTIRFCFLIQEKWEQHDEKDRVVAQFLKDAGLSHGA